MPRCRDDAEPPRQTLRATPPSSPPALRPLSPCSSASAAAVFACGGSSDSIGSSLCDLSLDGSFPSGGSLGTRRDPTLASLLTVNLQHRRVLVCGHGSVAAARATVAAASGAHVTVLSSRHSQRKDVRVVPRDHLLPSDLVQCDVLICTSAVTAGLVSELAAATGERGDVSDLCDLVDGENSVVGILTRACRRSKVWLHIAGRPEHSDFWFPPVATTGCVQLAVSTGGRAPSLGARLRDELRPHLTDAVSRAVNKMGHLRKLHQTLLDEEKEQIKVEHTEHSVSFEKEASATCNKALTTDPFRPQAVGRCLKAKESRNLHHLHRSTRSRISLRSPLHAELLDQVNFVQRQSEIVHSWSWDQIAAIEADLVDACPQNIPFSKTLSHSPENAHLHQSSSASSSLSSSPSRSAEQDVSSQTSTPSLFETQQPKSSSAHSLQSLQPVLLSAALSPISIHSSSLSPPEHAFSDSSLQNKTPLSSGSLLLPSSAHYLSSRQEQRNAHARTIERGTIYLVGAGPGAADLLTLRAARLLEQADLILADRLVPRSVYSECAGEVRVARKHPGRADEAQRELDDWGVEALRGGRTVVRLKCGDPFLFGRGGEEMEMYSRAGFRVEVVPGISSCLAAPLSAGISVTRRGFADRIMVATGTGAKDAMVDLPHYHPSTTLILLMSVHRISSLVETMIAQRGFPAEVPVAIVERATYLDQRTLFGTLHGLVDLVARNNVQAPSTLVIGQVVAAAPAMKAMKGVANNSL